jgi:hypothetical protein
VLKVIVDILAMLIGAKRLERKSTGTDVLAIYKLWINANAA